MNTPCPHCSALIEIDPATHATLVGHSHFACPACQGEVPVLTIVRPRLQLNPEPGSQPAAPAHPPQHPKTATASRKTNRNLLILGSTALLVLGGIAFSPASRKSGDTHSTTQNIRNEIINGDKFATLQTSPP